MPIDTERLEQGAYSGLSLAPNPSGNSGRSTRNSQTNSKPGPDADGGEIAETRLSSLDVLLTMLQSHLGEIRDFGGKVQFFTDSNGVIIRLADTGICRTHKLIHSGPTCPMC